ncbi:hypothetical protein CCMSSC00406_0000649 [Pleurotus cornucopiae]|uniref:Uncharacterized protein n=1 Tax=Pleurotus cornucopiae TaxID=5321 RepID=A0ACB7JBW0_PLECO|nr:hypothetical protein CCMSSC00406_0000649 [Pleurotus cornucopiae]
MLAANDTLSNILGWVSIACWIVVYSPQIYENYSLQSGEGLSVAFVVVWLLGDLCNLVGSAVAGLLPTVIIVAAYYTLCDSILLLQIYYYRWKKSSRLTSSDERAPLLATVNAEDVGLQQEQVMPAKALAIRYASASLFVCAAGVTAWWISSITTSDEEIPQHPRKALRWEIQAIGWTSAMLYLGARLPQILKNFKTRCAGLSPALFLFAILGNGTYGLSICAKSMDRRYLITNASWLAGKFSLVPNASISDIDQPSPVVYIFRDPLRRGLFQLAQPSSSQMTTLPPRAYASTFAYNAPYSPLLPARDPPLPVFTGYSPRSANASIPRLREAILTLDSKMAQLMDQRHELESHLERAVRLQSPVLRLPSELLSSIFIKGVLGMGDENPIMVSTLMLVCHYWADVALNTPVLWASIAVSPLDSLAKARRRLSRSKSCPIDVIINFGPRFEYKNSTVTEHVIHAMDLIRPALWRTKSLQLSVPSRSQAHMALLRCQEDAPLLETLSIRVFHAMQEDHYSNPPLPLFNGVTPRLRSCSFSSFNFGWDYRLLNRLTVLKLDGYFNGLSPSSSTLLGVLRQCPDLEELSLRNLTDSDVDGCGHHLGDDIAPATRPIHLPRLIKAAFYYSGAVLSREIIGMISFPALESLELCYLENITPIIQLLHNQSLTRLVLRYLRVESCLINEMKFVNLLRRLQSLRSLELVDVEDVTSGFLKALSSSQPWSCAKLESLSLDGCTNFDWESLRTFVESRLPANSTAYAHARHRSSNGLSSSASAAAAAYAHAQALQHRLAHRPSGMLGPSRLSLIDVTRCSQISKEMVQWLRMYVADVRCEPAKGIWGEPMSP